MPLLKTIVRANRKIVEVMTGLFYPLGGVLLMFFGIAALEPEPIPFKPLLPEWEAQLFMWGGFIAIISFLFFVVDMTVAHIIDKIKTRNKNALR